METTYDKDAESGNYTTVVFFTNDATKEDGIMTVSYDTPDRLSDAILADPTADVGSIVDFLS